MKNLCKICGSELDVKTGLCPKCAFQKNTKPQKKIKLLITISVILFLLITSITIVILSRFNIINAPFSPSVINQNNDVEILDLNNGDKVYHPSIEQISFDEKSNIVYFDDVLLVYTFSDLSNEESSELAKTVDGEIVGVLSGSINLLQIKVESSTLDELNKKAELLMVNEDVLYAGYDYPIQLNSSTEDNNPWSNDKSKPVQDKGNENSPNGNDWWAEAIGAYTAWENTKDIETIKVGILDSGFDVEHEDLSGSISFLSNYTENTVDNHGTHVAGLIAAKNNDIGIRGVSDNAELICVDWSPFANDSTDENYINYLSTGEYIEIIKQLIENEVRVINNSWGTHVKSKEGFTESLYGESNDLLFLLEYFAVHTTGSYESYLKYTDAYANRTALESMLMLIQLFLNDKEDFLIVQSAGNGYDNGGKGLDTNQNGFFCSIDEECFNQLSGSTKENLYKKGITYNKIDEHILIVGAVKNEKDSNGNYKMTSFSNFGDNVDICAPGEKIYSTIINNDYDVSDGTSMSGPIVAGCAALLWSTDMEQTAEQVRTSLISSATVKAVGVGDDKGSSYPFVNIGAAVPTNNQFYKDVINQYKTTIQNNFYEDILNGYSDDWDVIGDFVSTLLLSHARSFDENKVYYALTDINNDGTDELFIGASGDGGNIRKYDIFTYDGKSPVSLFYVGTFGERTNLTLYDNGVIYVDGSGGASIHSYEYYKLPNKTTKVELIEGFCCEDNVYYKTDIEGNHLATISESEFKQIQAQYKTQELALDWVEIVISEDGKNAPQNIKIEKDIFTISAGSFHTVGLKSDGTVVATGNNKYGECEVDSWTDIVAISASNNNTVGLKSDGTVVATGDNSSGQCDVDDWTNIIAVSGGSYHTVGLKSDGTVIATGDNIFGQCDVSNWKDIVAISTGSSHTVGLKSDGTVVATGFSDDGQCDISNWSNIIAISAGNVHTVGLKSDGTVVATGNNYNGLCDIGRWTDIVAVSANISHTVGLKSDGTVVAVGENNNRECNVNKWIGVIAISSGYNYTIGLKSDGTIVASGANNFGQCDVKSWSNITVPSAK